MPSSLPTSNPTSSRSGSLRRSRWWLGGGVALGVGLYAVGGEWGAQIAGRLLLPILLLGAVVQWRVRRHLESSGPGASSPWVRTAKGMWRPNGSGFYALIATLTFVHLQANAFTQHAREAWETWQGAPAIQEAEFFFFLGDALWGVVAEVLIPVGLETILNTIWAGLWPMKWIGRFGLLEAAGLIAGAYATYRLARYSFPGFDALMHRVDRTETDSGAEADNRVESDNTPST